MKYLLTKLALPASDYAVRMHTARPLPVSGSHPEYGEYPFENMLPAQIPDMNAYAREAVSGEDMNIYLELAYSGGPMKALLEKQTKENEERMKNGN